MGDPRAGRPPFSTKISSGWPCDTGAGLSPIRAAPAAVGGFSLLAVLVHVADEHPAAHAGVVAVAALVEATWRVQLNEGQGE
jgi:hypothetical protein